MFPVGASLFGIPCAFAVALDRAGEVSGDVGDIPAYRCSLGSLLLPPELVLYIPVPILIQLKIQPHQGPCITPTKRDSLHHGSAEGAADAGEVHEIGRVRAHPPTVVRRCWSRARSWPEWGRDWERDATTSAELRLLPLAPLMLRPFSSIWLDLGFLFDRPVPPQSHTYDCYATSSTGA
ncbi:hypothetical protein FIBSPDRAFT_964501 [Athelia psychrophila]|uniref:Uncharacterized protein n=1 Tax=Athelia psychrophila TaxID=1759441 RepID=A0A165XQ70_9AGAM|nr:hypothetical protein FIBSPDRAFT_964501 [Fibularhizoctonia sp. CBS 109695]